MVLVSLPTRLGVFWANVGKCSIHGAYGMLVNIPAPWFAYGEVVSTFDTESKNSLRNRTGSPPEDGWEAPPDLLPRFALWRPFIYIIYWYQPGCTGCQDGILQHSPTGYIHTHMSSLLLKSPAICSSTNSRFSPTGKCAMVCTSNYNPW